MRDAFLVRGAKASRDLPRDFDGSQGGQRAGEALALQVLAEVLARTEATRLTRRPRAAAVCLDALARAEALGMRPLAARCQATLGEPMPGVTLLATRSASPVLPVGIAGSERTWPIGARRPCFGTTVTIRFGPTLDLRRSSPTPPPMLAPEVTGVTPSGPKVGPGDSRV